MTTSINDLVLTIATVNGSGSQSSNNVLVKSLFRMGVPVTGKNLFPSNIAGLPTWFTIRANPKGFTARKLKADLVVALNPATINSDINLIKDNGFFLYEEGLTFNQSKFFPSMMLITDQTYYITVQEGNDCCQSLFIRIFFQSSNPQSVLW